MSQQEKDISSIKGKVTEVCDISQFDETLGRINDEIAEAQE